VSANVLENTITYAVVRFNPNHGLSLFWNAEYPVLGFGLSQHDASSVPRLLTGYRRYALRRLGSAIGAQSAASMPSAMCWAAARTTCGRSLPGRPDRSPHGRANQTAQITVYYG
jgi:hypothetical protein